MSDSNHSVLSPSSYTSGSWSQISCSGSDCSWSGSINRFLEHFRLSHDPHDFPTALIPEFKLAQCPGCKHWYRRINQHLPKCKAYLNLSKNAPSSLSQPVCGSSNNDSTASNSGQHQSSGHCKKNLGPPTSLQQSMSDLMSADRERAGLGCPKRTLSASREEVAWAFVGSLSTESISSAPTPRSVQQIASCLKSTFQDCCAIPLRKLESNPNDSAAWKLLFLIPRMLLQPGRGEKQSGIKKAMQLQQKFLNFQWEELIQLEKPSAVSKPSRLAQEQKKNAALRLIRCGEISKAAKVIISNGLAPASEETILKLKSKHPSHHSNVQVDGLKSQSANGLHLSLVAFLKAVHRCPKGSGSGPSGWRFEHLRDLCDNSVTRDGLFAICSTIAKGKIPTDIISLVSASRLIAIPKSNGDVRPIAIGECLRRLTAKAVCVDCKDSFSSYFNPVQHGVATPSGSELVIHHIQLLLEANPSWVMIKSDISNAFNSVDRQCLLSSVSSNFPELLPHVNQMYGVSSPLIFQKGSESVILSSEQGVHQGDPLGPVLFATSIHSTLVALQAKFPEVVLLAYLDDVFIVGQNNMALQVFASLEESFLPLNLKINQSKCELLSLQGDSNPSPIPTSTSGSVVLGSPVGTTSFVRSFCLSAAESGEDFCSRICNLDDSQSSVLLLRHCHSTRLNHLARTVPVSLLIPAAQKHDRTSCQTFRNILGTEDLSPALWNQISLPVKKGGFGVSPLERVSPAAFLAGWAHTCQSLLDRFPGSGSLLSSLSDPSESDGQIVHDLDEAAAMIPPLLLSDEDPKPVSYARHELLLADARKLQHRLSNAIAQKNTTALLASVVSDKDSARLQSLQGPYAGAWLDSIPSSRKFALSSPEFNLASCMRLGIPLPFGEWVANCECGSKLDAEGFHLLTCKSGGGPNWQHNSLVASWSDCLLDLGIHHRKEPRNRYSNSDDRPDIVVFDSENGSSLDLDVSFAHPWSKDYLKRTARICGFAAKKREDLKFSKYDQERLASGDSPAFTPLVFEHFGCWGEKAVDYLRVLSRKSRDAVGKSNTADFINFWRKRISVQIQKCNSRVLLRKIDRLTNSRRPYNHGQDWDAQSIWAS